MNSNNPISFFEDLILENRFDFHMKNFFQEAIDELSNVEVDKQNNVIYYYDINSNGKTIKISYSFNSYLRRLLRSKFRSLLESLETIKSNSSEIEFSKILNSINQKISYIKDFGNQTKYFDLAYAPLNELQNRINNGYFIVNNKIQDSNTISHHYLKVKHQFTKGFFDSLYEIASTYYLINDFDLTEIEFFEVLTSPVTASKIKFEVENDVAIAFMATIEDVFIDFNAKDFEKTKRFISRKGTPISQSSYNRYKNISPKTKPKVGRFISDVEKLIANYT